MSSKSFLQECQARVSSKSVLQEPCALVSSKGVLQECHLSESSQGVPQVGSLESVTNKSCLCSSTFVSAFGFVGFILFLQLFKWFFNKENFSKYFFNFGKVYFVSAFKIASNYI